MRYLTIMRLLARPAHTLCIACSLTPTIVGCTERGRVLGYASSEGGSAGGSDGTLGNAGNHAGSPSAGELAEVDGSVVLAGGAMPVDAAPFRDVCRPAVAYRNLDTTKGYLFDDAVSDPIAAVQDASATACALLYKTPAEAKQVASLPLLVEDFDGVAALASGEIRLSTRHLETLSVQGGDVAYEIGGLLHFVAALAYQHNGEAGAPMWVLTGSADFVRLRSGYFTVEDRPAAGTWTDGFRTTGFFFDWIAQEHSDFVRDLNLRLAPGGPGFQDAFFSEATGRNPDVLWEEYLASL